MTTDREDSMSVAHSSVEWAIAVLGDLLHEGWAELDRAETVRVIDGLNRIATEKLARWQHRHELEVDAAERLSDARVKARRIAESPTAPGLEDASLEVQQAAETLSTLTGTPVREILGKARTGFSAGHEPDTGAGGRVNDLQAEREAVVDELGPRRGRR